MRLEIFEYNSVTQLYFQNNPFNRDLKCHKPELSLSCFMKYSYQKITHKIASSPIILSIVISLLLEQFNEQRDLGRTQN